MAVVVSPLRLAPEWDRRFTRMVGVSAVAHLLLVGFLVVAVERSAPVPLPLTAYTVQITDPSKLGGRLPPGAPGRDLSGGSTTPTPAPESAVPEPPAAAKAEATPAPEPQAEPPPAPASPPEAKAPEPVPVPAPEPARPEPVPVAKAEPPKPKPEPRPVAKVEPKPAAKAPDPKPAKPAPEPKAVAKPTTPTPSPAPAAAAAKPKAAAAAGGTAASGRDAYAALGEKWKNRSGGGMGGAEGGTGPIGAGGPGEGGGGQLVGLEFIAYRQRVIATVKERWTNVISRAGLAVTVRFAIAPDGTLSDVRILESSGDAAYDTSAVRAVQHANPLPAPPAKYMHEFSEFQMKFESEDHGGGAG